MNSSYAPNNTILGTQKRKECEVPQEFSSVVDRAVLDTQQVGEVQQGSSSVDDQAVLDTRNDGEVPQVFSSVVDRAVLDTQQVGEVQQDSSSVDDQAVLDTRNDGEVPQVFSSVVDRAVLDTQQVGKVQTDSSSVDDQAVLDTRNDGEVPQEFSSVVDRAVLDTQQVGEVQTDSSSVDDQAVLDTQNDGEVPQEFSSVVDNAVLDTQQVGKVQQDSSSVDDQAVLDTQNEGVVSQDSVEDSCDSYVFPVLPLPDISNWAQKATNKSKMFVKWSNNRDGKRVYDKNHYCLFCEKASTNVTKHMLNKHKETTYIQDVLALPKKSSQRKLLLEKVRNLGDYKHNCAVRAKGEGEIIPWRCPTERLPATDYVPCPDCFAFFQQQHLWRHHKECMFCTHKDRKHAFRSLKAEAELLLPSTQIISDGLKDVLKSMKRDQHSLIMKNDKTILKFGEKMFQKHGHLKHLHQHISCKMRELARLLVKLRESDSTISGLQDCLNPEKFDIVVKAVKELCGFSQTTNKYDTPSLALKIGHSLKKCGAIEICAAIKECNDEKRKLCENFIYLCEKEWASEISSAALSTLAQEKMNKPLLLPLTEDIQKLNSFISSENERCSMALEAGTNIILNWQTLSKVTLASIIIFNRRRAGEAERMLIRDYNSRNTNPMASKDIADSLSEVEKVLCKTMTRIEIRGKKGRIVPVIMTPRLVAAVDLLNAKRIEVGIPEDNDFIFARPLSNKPLRATDCLRKLAVTCGAKCPANLTSTRLRKHIATTSQILNLKECELDILAGFLGHDIRVHRNFYRLPQDTLQLAKVSKILVAFDKGSISDYKGKSLDEMNVENDLADVEESEASDYESDNDQIDQQSSTQPERRSKAAGSSQSLHKKSRSRAVDFVPDTDVEELADQSGLQNTASGASKRVRKNSGARSSKRFHKQSKSSGVDFVPDTDVEELADQSGLQNKASGASKRVRKNSGARSSKRFHKQSKSSGVDFLPDTDVEELEDQSGLQNTAFGALKRVQKNSGAGTSNPSNDSKPSSDSDDSRDPEYIPDKSVPVHCYDLEVSSSTSDSSQRRSKNSKLHGTNGSRSGRVANIHTLQKARGSVSVHRPWSTQQREAVMANMAKFVLYSQVPGKSDIVPWLSNYECLSERSWKNVKDFVRNLAKSK